MNALRLILLELRHRPVNALAAVLATALAVALFNFTLLSGETQVDRTRVIQRDSGLNLILLDSKQDLDRYWERGYAEEGMPETLLDSLEDQAVANRLIPLLKQWIEVEGTRALLTGIGGEIFKGGKRMKAVFGLDPAPGTCVVGGSIASRLQLERGDTVVLLGEPFEVATVLSEVGTDEDATVYVAVAEAQRLLGRPGELNEIQAIECHCGAEVTDPLAHVRAELTALLPGVQVLRKSATATARRQQRLLAEQSLKAVLPIVGTITGLIIGLLAFYNVRERWQEIGVWLSVGHGGSWVATLFGGRAVVIGWLGALLGIALTRPLAGAFGDPGFPSGLPALADAAWIGRSLLFAIPFAVGTSLGAIAIAACAEPGKVLRHG